MQVVSGIVLYAVIWFLTMLVVLPIRLKTQGDVGEVVPGTQAGAPAEFRLNRTLVIVTIAATLVWSLIAGIIVYGDIGVRDIDFFGRMGPAPE